jgi:hypothetical protein
MPDELQPWVSRGSDELERRRVLRRSVQELIRLTACSSLTRAEIQDHLQRNLASNGRSFWVALLRALGRDDAEERQAAVQLLVMLAEPETLVPLRRMVDHQRLPRVTRLAAALVLAGMGETLPAESERYLPRRRRYAIS